jgi:hypothetical protein
MLDGDELLELKAMNKVIAKAKIVAEKVSADGIADLQEAIEELEALTQERVLPQRVIRG